MTFLKFKKQFDKYIIFSTQEIKKYYPNFNKMNLLTWQKKGYLQKNRNSWYSFTDITINETTLYYMANKIYKPSYISLETALHYYGIIPEAVFFISSISTVKTQKFKTKQSLFTYSNLKKDVFLGYKLIQTKNYTFKIAEIEKTILDFLFLRPQIKTYEDIIALRWNKQILQEKINLQKMMNYTTIYNSKTLTKKIKIFINFLND